MEQKNYNLKYENFVNYIFEHKEQDKRFSALLKRADNDDTRYYSWEILARWIDLSHPWEEKAYGIIAASIARSKLDHEGELSLGGAIAHAFEVTIDKRDTKDKGNPAASSRLQRLWSSKDAEDLIRILRPLLSFLASKDIAINHSQLLSDILRFDFSQQDKIKARWAQDFYSAAFENFEKGKKK